MQNPWIIKIVETLADDDTPIINQFCAEAEISPSDISVEVDGLGIMPMPATNEYIQQLIKLSSKAKFGLREKTLQDDNFRNTQEITADKLNIKISEKHWQKMLDKMRDELGLGADSKLTAHLHNMLIYGQGQFFDTHQDSEKLENMVATLVIVLPSAHIGGDLVIEHGKNEHIFSSENIAPIAAKCIAFYADCKHKVEKVKQGFRIALTYNLVLENSASLKCTPWFGPLIFQIKM